MAIPLGLWAIVSIFGLVPPFSRDALNDHMMLPHLWEAYGLFWRDSSLSFTAYPPLADLPYILFAGFSWDWAASVWHALGGVVTLFFLDQAMLHLHINRQARAVVLFSWISSPVVIALCTWTYVDLWLCAVAAALAERLLRLRWSRSDAMIFGALLGLGAMIKYNGVVLLIAGMLGLAWRWRLNARICVVYFLLTGAVCTVIAGGWYLSNWFILGQPLYPLGGGNDLTWLQFREMAYHESFWWALLAPLRQFFWGEVNQARLFDGMLHPLWLLGFVAIFLWRKSSRVTALGMIACVYIVVALSTGVRARYWLPGVTMLLPVLGLIFIRGKRPVWKTLVAASFIPGLLSGGMYLHQLAPWDFWLYGRDAFLETHVPDYRMSRWIKHHLASDARIYLLWMGGRAYYLERSYVAEIVREGEQLQRAIKQGKDFPFSHILMQRDLADKTLGADLKERWRRFLANSCRVRKTGPYELWELTPCSQR